MRKHIYIISIAVLLGLGQEAAAQNTDAAVLQATAENVANDPALSQSILSICARKGDGTTLIDIDADNMVIPASNMKLISTGAALHHLGSEFRFSTGIGYSGEIREGVLYGDLYIKGGGDPCLASKDSIATPTAETFALWEKMVREAGIRRIDGRIIGDGRYFDGMAEHGTWQTGDLGTYYGAGATGLMFYENMQSFMVTAGEKVGDPVDIKPHFPDTPWVEIRHACSTGKAGTGDQLYLYSSDLSPVAEMRGTFAVDRQRKRLDCSNRFPEYTCASYFADYLKTKGIHCSRGASDFRLCSGNDPDAEIMMIGSTSSPELKRIVFETNHASNNLYAETLLKTLGKNLTGSACYDSSYVALNTILKELNVDTSYGARIVDGSGLSRQNYVSADFLCRFLEAMMHSPCFEDYIATLPSPGSNGTLAANMKNSPAEIKERVKVKSGSMNGVRCYSGYIIPTEGCKDDTIVFSIMVNNSTSPTWKVRSLLDKIMAALAAAN